MVGHTISPNPLADFANAQLIAMGDCHTFFFTGTNDTRYGNPHPNLLAPEIRQYTVGSATAWNLMSETSRQNTRNRVYGAFTALAQTDFSGYVLISLGYGDVNRWSVRNAQTEGIYSAVKKTVDRYLAALDELRQIYPKVAVWGCPPTVSNEHTDLFESLYGLITIWGTEIERNYATLLFNGLLQAGCEARGIPFLSLFDLTILPSGLTNPKYFYDSVKYHQMLMPYTRELLHKELGVVLPQDRLHHSYTAGELASGGSDTISEIPADSPFTLPMKEMHRVETGHLTFARSGNVGDMYFRTYNYKNPGLCTEWQLIARDFTVMAGQEYSFPVNHDCARLEVRLTNAFVLPSRMALRGPVCKFFMDEPYGANHLHAMRGAAAPFIKAETRPGALPLIQTGELSAPATKAHTTNGDNANKPLSTIAFR